MPRLRLLAEAGFFIQFTIKESSMKTIAFSSIKGGTGKSSL